MRERGQRGRPTRMGSSRNAVENGEIAPAWHRAENLEREARAAELLGIEDLDLRKDFESYALVNRTDRLTATAIETHNAIDQISLDYRYRSIVHMEGIDSATLGMVVDLGCGLGFTTGALKRLVPWARVVGIDASAEATAYASRRFPACEFIGSAIGFDRPFPTGNGEQVDRFVAQEFYPFTRTDDWSYKREWVRYLLTLLRPGQRILCVLGHGYRRDGVPTIWRNWDCLREEFGANVREVPAWRLTRLGLHGQVNIAAVKLLRQFSSYRNAGTDVIVIRAHM